MRPLVFVVVFFPPATLLTVGWMLTLFTARCPWNGQAVPQQPNSWIVLTVPLLFLFAVAVLVSRRKDS